MRKTFKRLSTKQELVKYLNSVGMARKLNTRKNLILDNGKDVKVKLSDGGSYTDFETITIGVPCEQLIGQTQGRVTLVLDGLTIHECYHILRTNNKLWNMFIEECSKLLETKYSIPEYFAKCISKDMLNGVEDGRIERIASAEDYYQAKCLAITNATLFSTDSTISQKGSPEEELRQTIFCFCTYAVLGIPAYGYYAVYKDNVKYLEKAKKHIFDYVNQDNMQIALDSLYLAVEACDPIFKRLFDEIDFDDYVNHQQEGDTIGEGCGVQDPSNQPGQSSTSSQSTNQGNVSASSSDNNDNDENGQGNASTSSNDNNDNDENGQGKTIKDMINEEINNSSLIKNEEEIDYNRLQDSIEDIMDNILNDIEEDLSKDEEEAIAQVDFANQEAEKKEKEELNEVDSSDLDDIASSMGLGYNEWRDFKLTYKYHNYTLQPMPSSITSEVNYIRPKLQKLLDNKISSVKRNRTRGQLNTSSLWKLSARDNKVFQKKGKPNTTDFAIYILMDRSGSMHRYKFEQALRATSILEECLKGLTPLKIVTFCEYDDAHILHDVVKNFSDTENANYSFSYYNNNSAMGCNVDGFSIRVATSELMKRKEKDKMLIILSDGQPNGAMGYSGQVALNDVKDAVNSARKKGVKVFNIAFAETEYDRNDMAPIFSYMYEKGLVSCAPEYIGEELIRIINNEIR